MCKDLETKHASKIKNQKDEADERLKRKVKSMEEIFEAKTIEMTVISKQDTDNRVASNENLLKREIAKLESNYTERLEAVSIARDDLIENQRSHSVEMNAIKSEAKDRLNEATLQLDTISKEKETELTLLTAQYYGVQKELAETNTAYHDFKDQSKIEIEGLVSKQDQNISVLEAQLTVLEDEKVSLRKSWNNDKLTVEKEYESKLGSLRSEIASSESEIEKHQNAVEEIKSKLENDMKTFEAEKQKELEQIRRANDEEKASLVEKLEEMTKATEIRIRKSLDEMKFHRSQQQIYENTADKLEKEKQVMEEEKEEAQAEVHLENQEKM